MSEYGKSERFQLFEAGRDVGRQEVYDKLLKIADEWKTLEYDNSTAMSRLFRDTIDEIKMRLKD